MTKLLIATTNPGKFKEIKHFLNDLPFDLIFLGDLENIPKEPVEDKPDIEGNAILKARYYGEKTGLMSLADDGGLFVDILNGWPGVISARIADTVDGRSQQILNKLEGVPEEKRGATFKACLALYDPTSKQIHLTYGETKGKILKESVQPANGFGYDPIFYVEEIGKAYAEMTMQQKNNCSHRGKALGKMKYFLANQYGTKHIVVPFGIIADKGKILICKRNDPANPNFHGKWELPGGVLEFGETMEENVARELLEETNYKVEVVKRLDNIHVTEREYPNTKLQIILIPFVCKVIAKNGHFNDAEIMEMKWIEPEDYVNYDYIGENKEIFGEIMPEIKRIVEENKL
ncbi:RdgB/HAM1 family non-canonical purine NTP pyrophosphatase [Patescibacteria group bacterium]|nr:RdgB/HAM1 family non-canonical purine NTP pyrophosphatase [Patescibacteria group bacterium]